MKWDTPKVDDLLSVVVQLKNADQAKRFFRDLLTESELLEFSSRWQAAQMLADKVPYPVITQKTGLSSTTIARVSKWLNKGMGGYKLALEQSAQHKHHRKSLRRRGLS